MYEEFYHFTEKPFTLSPDPAFLFLGKSALKMRTKPFWDYHRGELEALGWSWSWTLIFGWSLVAALTLFLNPLSTTMQFFRRLRARLPGFSQPS